ncbi:hypothetical protein BC351_10725 [Paenibacillus ferrarius]|uniref:AntA/AntB antirepressor domain-containing protein n=1 Tax=Paenibacillus ferrarius TaxID=1469647 RepID=A0A1V4H8V7_9BACL|nr:antA/AntB antirepressor family protein [Paenibacillus ferrarius]OPH47655.1 hypothetical protein BC351_10725 [Paenibacillus ferrarius]
MVIIKLENGNTVKLFEKNDVIEKLGRTIDEWKLVDRYQTKFPILSIVESKDKLPIDSEELCEAMGVDDPFTSWLLADRAKVKGKLIKYRFVRGEDFIEISRKSTGGRPKTEIKLSINCAKKIAMRQNNDAGNLVADYFILMELLAKDMDKWISVREPEKDGWTRVKKALYDNYILTHDGKKPDHTWFEVKEADLIDLNLFGYKAGDLRELLKMDDNVTRNHLTIECNQALYEVQILVESLILSGVVYKDRFEYVKNYCQSKFKHIPSVIEELKKIKG